MPRSTARSAPVKDEESCWARARRKFFDLARLTKAPIALEAVVRTDALFAIEREINGNPSPERRRVGEWAFPVHAEKLLQCRSGRS